MNWLLGITRELQHKDKILGKEYSPIRWFGPFEYAGDARRAFDRYIEEARQYVAQNEPYLQFDGTVRGFVIEANQILSPQRGSTNARELSDCPMSLDFREPHRGPSKQHPTDEHARAHRGPCR